MSDGLVRFRRMARKLVRDYVKETREPPPLTLYVSHGERAQKVAAVAVGAGRSAGEVAVNVREGVREAGASFAAIGRALADVQPGSAGPLYTTTFGLVVCAAGRLLPEFWTVEIRAGRVGAWEARVGADSNWGAGVANLLMSALRDVSRAIEEDPQARLDAAAARAQGQKDAPDA